MKTTTICRHTPQLECPICLTVSMATVTLSCSHVFCIGCTARILQSQPDTTRLPCPMCRKVTFLPNGELVNFGAASTAHRLLKTDCECSDFVPSEDNRRNYAKLHESSVSNFKISLTDKFVGHWALGRRPFCPLHPGELVECFCTDCQYSVCFRCGMLGHVQEGHYVVDAWMKYDRQVPEHISFSSDDKPIEKPIMEDYVQFIDEQRKSWKTSTKTAKDNTDNPNEDSCQRSTSLLEPFVVPELSHREGDVSICIEPEEGHFQQRLYLVDVVNELLSNQGSLGIDTHASSFYNPCEETTEKEMGGDSTPLSDYPKDVQLRSEKTTSCQQTPVHWPLRAVVDLPHRMITMATTPEGEIVVVTMDGDSHLITADGLLLKSGVKTGRTSKLGLMSGGRYLTLDSNNAISVYTRECEKLPMTFETLSHNEGGFSDLAVDAKDNIYTSYRKAKAIMYFSGLIGGKAISRVACDFEPIQLVPLMSKSAGLLVVDNANVIRIIDPSGAVKHILRSKGENYIACPTACRDGSIIVAWIDHTLGYVDIDRYTGQLKYLEPLVTEHKIRVSMPSWFSLAEFPCGEIAFCVTDRLYIFDEPCEREIIIE